MSHPLILIEVIPVVGSNTDNDGRSGNCPPISAPLAKLQLMQMCQREMFHIGWMQRCDDVSQKRSKQRNRPEQEDIATPTSSYCGMFLRIQRSSHDRTEGDAPHSNGIASGFVYLQNSPTDMAPSIESSSSVNSIPISYLKSDNPLFDSIPCILRGHIFDNAHNVSHGTTSNSLRDDVKCFLVDGTAVQVLPPSDGKSLAMSWDCVQLNNFSAHRSSEAILTQSNDSKLTKSYSKLSCYDKETVRALTLRMSIMLMNTTWIGTTRNALAFWEKHFTKTIPPEELGSVYELQQRYYMNQAEGQSNRFHTVKHQDPIQKTIEPVPIPYLLREGALLLYNSHPNSGKTSLVTTIAKEVLKCNAIHVLSAPVLFAKYGVIADAALETLLHELVLRGAVQRSQCESGIGIARVCIVLDHFETFVDYGSSIDAYSPVLNSMASYLNRLSASLKNKNEFPFPTSNQFYNKCTGKTTSRSPGFALPVGICIIAVMTCQEHDNNKQLNNSLLSRAFDAVGGGRMKLALPSAATRLSAFRDAFTEMHIELDDDAEQLLPELSASATWAYDKSFIDVATRLRSTLNESGINLATKNDVQKAMDFVASNTVRSSAVIKSSLSITSAASGSTPNDLFKTVGGNNEAKLALEDALALNPKKRRLLSLFGMNAPTGVLLYGPPGTGKTLLARAIAKAISLQDKPPTKNIGGTFISLKASDIVRPEIGNSEKLVVSAFESARVNAPSVVFIDEFQALFGEREGSGAIVGQLASTLLQCMDDVTRWSGTEPSEGDKTTANGRIVVLGATNTPWMIDKAFLRPGRFDRTVHVGLPSLEEREEILRVHIGRMKLAQTEDVDKLCSSMAKLCLGFSGADLAALCRAAAVRCLSAGDDEDGIKETHYKDAFMNDVIPSSNDELVKRISSWKA